MGGKKRPKTAKSGKSGGKKGKKGKKDDVQDEAVDLGPKVPETQKECLICKNIMVEPVKLGDAPHVWFCVHCIKHAKASQITQDNDDEDEGTKPPVDADPEKAENKYKDLLMSTETNPKVDLELQEKLKAEFTVEYEAQYEVLAKKDLLSDAEKKPV